MRNQWRLLLPRSYSRSSLHNSTKLSHFQVPSSSNRHVARSFSSLLNQHSFLNSNFQSTFDSHDSRYVGFNTRSFSSEVAVEENDVDHMVIIDAFSKENDFDEIKKELELRNVVLSHEFILKVLCSLEFNVDVARRFFDWVLRVESERLSSKSYNLMLSILGVNGLVEEFWNLVGTMKEKGYGVSKGVYVKVLEKFEKEGLESDVEKFRGIYASGSLDNSMEKISSRISKIIRNEVWGDEVETKLRGFNITFSTDLVKMVLDNLTTEPAKALIFFRWIEERDLLKHNGKSYNAVLMVLGREDCIDRFWKVADEMRGVGYEMEKDTYVKVLERFLKRRMIKDAVDLYEFAMLGEKKPSVQDCTSLLRKIVVSKDFDINLFSRAVRIYTDGGNLLTNSTLNAVLKSLRSVGRYGECNIILKAMEEGGFTANTTLQREIAFQLSKAGRKDEVSKFMENLEVSGSTSDIKTWASLIEGHCEAGNLDDAFDSFQEMVEKEGVSSADYALDLLVNAFCNNSREIDACKLLSDMVSQKDLRAWHTTYKTLITKLLAQGEFQGALNLLGLMKNHGFPPYLDPFIGYISKTGTGDDAVIFLKAMTVKKFPSTSVFLRVFQAFFESRRHEEAQDFLSKCPGYIRNHADVLNLFCTMESRKPTSACALQA